MGRYVPTTITDDIIIRDMAYKMATTPLEKDHFEVIYSLVEKGSLKEIDSWGENSIERDLIYKKLYYTLNQIKSSHKNKNFLNTKDKLIFSMEFYDTPDRWALYHRSRGVFYITTNNFCILEATPKEALDYYEYKLGQHCLLDSNEIGNENIQASVIEEVDIFEMEKKALNTINPVNQQPLPPPPNFNMYNPNINGQETYGFNFDNIVTDYVLDD